MFRKAVAILTLLIPLSLTAQSVKDTSLLLHMFSFHGGGYLPAGDIAKRYGGSMGVGGSYWLKGASNWVFKADFSYFSGNNFKADSMFDLIRDQYGHFITTSGEYGSASVYFRGFYAGLQGGRLFPMPWSNPNSGLVILGSAGLLQYWTHIYQEEKNVPLLNGKYKEGWDHQTNGFALNQFIGYLHLDSNRPLNFYLGFDFYQAWTRNRRDWNFDLMGPEPGLKHDFIFGFRFGWIFPVNKRISNTYYFY